MKQNSSPLDFPSRHPLPETGTNSVERVINQIVSSEYNVVLKHIQDETRDILKGDGEQYRKNIDIFSKLGDSKPIVTSNV